MPSSSSSFYSNSYHSRNKDYETYLSCKSGDDDFTIENRIKVRIFFFICYFPVLPTLHFNVGARNKSSYVK